MIVFFEKKELGRTSVGCQFRGEVLGVADLAARDDQLGAVGEAEIRGGHLCEAAMTVVSALLWLKIDPTYPLDSGGGEPHTFGTVPVSLRFHIHSMYPASTLHVGAVPALMCLLPRASAFISSCLLSIGRVLALGTIITAPVFAEFVLISEARSVYVSYYGSGIETHSSDGSFGLFDASAIGTPFGGGSLFVQQRSLITPSEISVEHSIIDGFGPGGVANSDFQVKFSLPEASRLTISGYSAYFSGPASLVSESLGAIPLVWGPDAIYQNYLDFDEVLMPGVYTFTSNEWLRGDGIVSRFELRAQAPSVPEGGTTAWMFAVGALSLLAIRGKPQSDRKE